MQTAQHGAAAPMSPYYKPGEHRTQQLTSRVTKSIKVGIEKLARAWTHMERYREDDPDAEVNASDVVNRLLGEGLDGAWEEIGFEPETEEQWKELFHRIEKSIDAARLAKRPAPEVAINNSKKK